MSLGYLSIHSEERDFTVYGLDVGMLERAGFAARFPGIVEPEQVLPAALRSKGLTPTVFLPGLLCDAALWRYQVDALSDIIAPVVADLTLDDSIEGMARRVLLVAPQKFALVALSMGGYVALEIMRVAPERVTRLVLLDTSARADTPQRAAERRAGMASLRRGKFVGVTGKLLTRLVHPSHTDDEVGSSLRAMAARVGGTAFLRQQQAILHRKDSRSFLCAISVPTLVIVGDGDSVTPPAEAEELAMLIPNARLHVVKNAGHMTALESPHEVSGLLREWLRRG